MNELSIYEDLLRLPGLKIERIEPSDRRIEIYGQVDEGPQPCPNCAGTLYYWTSKVSTVFMPVGY